MSKPHRYANLLYSISARLWAILIALALLLSGVLAYFTDAYRTRLVKEVYRNSEYELAANASALSAAIGSKLLLTNGIQAFTLSELARQQRIDHDRFDLFSLAFIGRIKGIRNISVYPDGVARYVFPLEGNERLLGLNLFEHKDEAVRANALRTKLTDDLTILGPMELAQGGVGFLSRQSIYLGDRFWGFVSVVLDISPILQEADLFNADKGIDIAVRANGRILKGDPSLFDSPKLLEQVVLPEGYWEIAAVPKAIKLESIRLKVGTARKISALSVLLVLYLAYVLLTQKTKLRSLVDERTLHLEDAISRLEHKEHAVRHIAYSDAVTGLYNRTYFNEHLAKSISDSEKSGQSMAVLFLDLDQFKMVNDTIGHSQGDILLREVARRLSLALTDGETVSRIGGDEFTVIVPEAAGQEQIKQLAHRIRELFQHPFVLMETEYFITTSIGVALYPDHGEDVTTLIRNADTAMYRAKEEGKNQYRFYESSLSRDAKQSMDIKNSLRRAIERDEFAVHYQPQIEARSGKIIGLEALIRWYHPKQGFIPPGSFIPIAEETGLIVPIGERVLQMVCAQSRAWRQAGLPPIRIAVNLSARQFSQKDLVQSIKRILDDNGLDPHDIELEITENMAMKDEMQESLQEMKDMGFTISIDDFGTQYSSLGYLKRLPIHKIKIDRSFVNGISKDPKDEAIIMAMLLIANRLHLTVIAEGVETNEQLAFLQDNDCEEIQGYIFHKPQPAENIAALLAEQAAKIFG